MAGRSRRRIGAALGAGALVGALALSGCSGSGSNGASSASGARAPYGAGAAPQAAAAGNAAGTGGGRTGSSTSGGGDSPGSAGSGAAQPTGRSLIYTGEMQLRTTGVDTVVAEAERLVTSVGGYVDSEVTGPVGELPLDQYPGAGATGSAGDDSSLPLQTLPQPSDVGAQAAQLVVRIPTASYDAAYRRLLGLGVDLGQERASQDVTEQVVDVASRLKTQQASVDRVRALMDRAQSLSDVIALEAALTQRESDLESLEAQQQSLESQTALSTVTVQVFQNPPAAAPAARHHGAGRAALDGLADGWHGLYLTFRALLVALSAALPFALVLLALGWPAVLLIRRRRPRTASAAPAAEQGPPKE
jgi:hypothetical protein